MAGQGKYAGLGQDAPFVGGFAGKEQFARMAQAAQAEIERDRADRAAQAKLKDASKKALDDAMAASKIDYTKINEKLHGAASAVNDKYKEDFYNAYMENERTGSSSSKRAMEKIADKRDADIAKYELMTSTVKNIQEGVVSGDYDDMLNAEVVNGMNEYLQWVNGISEEGLSTGDLNTITEAFNQRVDTSKLVGKVDIDGWEKSIVGATKFGENEDFSITNGVKSTVTTKYLTRQQKEDLKKQYVGGLDEYKFKKKALIIQNQYDNMPEGRDKEVFADKYITTDKNGSHVTRDAAFKYFYDTKVSGLVSAAKSEDRPVTGDDMTERDKLNRKRFDNVNAFVSGENIGAFNGSYVSYGGVQGTLNGTELRYDPETQKTVFVFDVNTKNGSKPVNIPMDNNSAVTIGNMFFRDWPYNEVGKELNLPVADVKVGMNARSEGIQNNVASLKAMTDDMIGRLGENTEENVEAAIVESVKRTYGASGSVSKYINEITDQFGVGNNILFAGERYENLPNNPETVAKLKEDVANVAAIVAVHGDNSKKEIEAYYKNKETYIIDPLQKIVEDIKDPAQSAAMYDAIDGYVKQGKTTDEILQLISQSPQTAQKPATLPKNAKIVSEIDFFN